MIFPMIASLPLKSIQAVTNGLAQAEAARSLPKPGGHGDPRGHHGPFSSTEMGYLKILENMV